MNSLPSSKWHIILNICWILFTGIILFLTGIAYYAIPQKKTNQEMRIERTNKLVYETESTARIAIFYFDRSLNTFKKTIEKQQFGDIQVSIFYINQRKAAELPIINNTILKAAKKRIDCWKPVQWGRWLSKAIWWDLKVIKKISYMARGVQPCHKTMSMERKCQIIWKWGKKVDRFELISV